MSLGQMTYTHGESGEGHTQYGVSGRSRMRTKTRDKATKEWLSVTLQRWYCTICMISSVYKPSTTNDSVGRHQLMK